LHIDNPSTLESHINDITGVVCNGIFANRGADVLLISTPDGVVRIR
jgi:ribose 5-phosphate isomerase A